MLLSNNCPAWLTLNSPYLSVRLTFMTAAIEHQAGIAYNSARFINYSTRQ